METPQKRASAGKWSAALLLFCGVLLTLGGTAWLLLNRAAHQQPDTAPAPRKGINAPFITTSDVVVDNMVELAGLKPDDVVYDLGCGDGRIVITAALKSGCSGVGFDIDPERVAEALENARLHEVDDRVEIVEQDIFTVDLSKADVAMMYLLPWMMNKLLPQFQAMKDGCRIVSHDFWIDGVQPDESVEIIGPRDNDSTIIYVYRTPLRLDPAMEKGRPPHEQERPSPDHASQSAGPNSG